MKLIKLNRNKEEILNTISHAAGVLFGIFGLIYLLFKNKKNTDFSTISIWIYGVSMIALFLSSTFYHYLESGKLKNRARILDHMSIFLLIAGTYTPVCLITLEKSSGWLLFTIVWSIAALGIILKIFLTGKVDKLSLLLYLSMGWLIIFDIRNIIDLMSLQALIFLIIGGLLYSLGTIFYVIEKIPYSHFIWHLFVLGGSISHFFMVDSLV
ncbi:hemolysin III family protein [Apibacter muscae]|uniref:PAQR family membrane homeostasis protein TrhA n=1 Tax=Apibacter muscae TaxID=2509004 RepID=UPI0011AC95C9|nr:hemolysin III family protein [Apibacter muscae]TWP22758.1 hemolysin III family protein [Apibacter muscae]TWP28206.1 hemolysin III family protein [Apibacter muscae]